MKGLTAKFYKDEIKGNMVEVKIIASGGNGDTHHRRVTGAEIEGFPLEWKAFQDGAESIDYGGTLLTDVPGITHSMAMNYKCNGIHNAEMLADIPDIACKNLGMGALEARKAAKNLIDANASKGKAAENDALKERIAALEAAAVAQSAGGEEVRRGPGRPPNPKPLVTQSQQT